MLLPPTVSNQILRIRFLGNVYPVRKNIIKFSDTVEDIAADLEAEGDSKGASFGYHCRVHVYSKDESAETLEFRFWLGPTSESKPTGDWYVSEDPESPYYGLP